jgi:hypothetical protein
MEIFHLKISTTRLVGSDLDLKLSEKLDPDPEQTLSDLPVQHRWEGGIGRRNLYGKKEKRKI